MYVSEFGDLCTSGLEITKRMFLLFFTVTRTMLGTGFMPSFCTAFLVFFSDLFCLERSSFLAPSAASRFGISSSVELSSSLLASFLASSVLAIFHLSHTEDDGGARAVEP